MTREKLEYLRLLSHIIDSIENVLEVLKDRHIVVSRWSNDGNYDYVFSSLDNGYEFTRNLITDALKKKLKEYQEEFERG